ncbi:MAG: hypothetical protein LUE95_05105, partial [Oscillospiraceae bacterium]|nr:hypothetical protein [Oscillospiraceae bacterium]
YRSGHNGAVLKTVRVQAHGGSNPSLSARTAFPDFVGKLEIPSGFFASGRDFQRWGAAPRHDATLIGFAHIVKLILHAGAWRVHRSQTALRTASDTRYGFHLKKQALSGGCVSTRACLFHTILKGKMQ